MEEIKLLVKKIIGNIEEAKEAEFKAIEWMDTDRALADWYHAMAQAHLQFNTPGHALLEKRIAEAKVEYKDSPLLPGMLAIYKDQHNDIKQETARVKSMIDMYGKT